MRGKKAIGTVTATDGDGDTITYSMSGDNGSIIVDSQTGVLRFDTEPDEAQSTHRDELTAVSDGTNSITEEIKEVNIVKTSMIHQFR